MTRIIIPIVLAALPPSAMAATLRVPSQYGNIQLAIDTSSDGDSVLVAPGLYSYEIGFNIIGKSIHGNISMDPLFCGILGSGNFHLQSSSPCAAANVPAECAGQQMGCFPASCTVGTKDESWGSIESLFGTRK